MTEAVALPTVVLRRLARWPAATLFFLCLVAWVPGFFTLPPLDRDESRFAQASKQMVETGNLVDIRFSEGARYNKPIGIYWLQAASAKVFGGPAHNEIWTYRLPSLLGRISGVAVRLLVRARLCIARDGASGRGAPWRDASDDCGSKDRDHRCRIAGDHSGGAGGLLRIYLAARDATREPPGLGFVLAGWAAVAAGILVKGPVILAVLGVTGAAVSLWDRDWRWLKSHAPALGIALAALLVAPWAIAIGIESHGAFYQQSLGHDFADKIIGGQESHGAPPGYFLAALKPDLVAGDTACCCRELSCGLDVSQAGLRDALSSRVGGCGLAAVRTRADETAALHSSRLSALAMLGALWAMRPALLAESRRARIARFVACAPFFVVSLALAAAPIFAAWKFGERVSPLVVIGVGVVSALGTAATIMLVRRKLPAAALFGILAAVIVYPTLAVGVAPNLLPIWTSPRAAELIARESRPNDPPVVLAGYVEPSLVFLLGTNTRLETGITAADLAAHRGGLVMVDDHERDNFLAVLAALHAPAAIADGLSGYDYSRGHSVHLTLYRVTAAPQIATPPAQ
jgi:4-amino-4-deoxy-L-arabinose transferase-like glycosyltransferase